MPAAPLLHHAPAGTDAAELAAALAARLGGAVEGPRAERRTVLDTFDWRVHREGLALEHVVAPGGGTELALRAWGGPTVTAAPARPHPPVTSTDLPAGRLRDRLGPLLDSRGLVEAVAYDAIVHVVVVRNGDDKAVARVAVDDLGGGEVVVRLLPVRGYDRAAGRALAAVIAAGCEPGARDPAEVALGAHGRRPGDGTGTEPALDGRGPAAAGWLTVLARQLDAVEANLPGALDGRDPEALHDLRVAVRRSRSGLRHARHVLPKDLRSCFRPELRWVQEATGAARDLDVLATVVHHEVEGLGAERAAALEPLVARLDADRSAARERCVAALRSARFAALVDDWRATLAALTDALDDHEAGEWGDWPRDAHRPLRKVAAARIRDQHAALLRRGRAIDASSPATELHELRKDAKELRYLVELFGSVLRRERTRPFVRSLKRLQDALGEHQDAEVQVHAVEAVAAELGPGGDAGPATREATAVLVERLRERQRLARARFDDRFSRFAAVGRP